MRPQFTASGIQTAPDEASLPTPVSGIWMFRVLEDSDRLFFSNGATWIDLTLFIEQWLV